MIAGPPGLHAVGSRRSQTSGLSPREAAGPSAATAPPGRFKVDGHRNLEPIGARAEGYWVLLPPAGVAGGRRRVM